MATSPNRKKRPSMAAVARYQAELEARRKTQELPPEVANVIATYDPAGVPAATMREVRPFLVEVITASKLRGRESVRKHCNHLTKFACFAIKRGVPLGVEHVMTTSFIDEYVRETVIDYFKEADTDDVKIAFQELKDDEITWEEIQLMRLKFLSDYGN